MASAAGAFLGYVGSGLDIHARKLEEEGLRSSSTALHRHHEELKEFAYGASHDLQEPLRTISNHAQLLATCYQGQLSTEWEDSVRFVTQGAQRMQASSGDLLDYSRVLYRSALRLLNVDCNAAFEQVLFACQAATQETGAVATHDPLPDICADRAQWVRESCARNGS